MAEIKQIRAIKGVRDILPPESAAWNRVEQAAHEVFAGFGYGEIRLPIFEETELFARSVGADTDIVGKEMYTFVDRDDESVSLRPEATASVCRAYIEHGMHVLPGNVKLYYAGPMFRRERPQKGRYRQFYQIGAEVLGQSDAPGIDAELIEMLMAFFERAGLEGAALQINSIGCKECRAKYVEVLRAALVKVKDKLGADSQRRIETNPLRVLDSKLPEEQAIIEKLPRISEHLCADCRDHFAEVRRQLDLRGIAYEQNWRLVRGLDYYMRTTFEITAPGLGSQNAVCGGGRYDGLVELLGGPPTKGIGFAIGEDRLMLSLEAAGKVKPEASVDAFIVWMGASAQAAAIKLARVLRNAGVKVEVPAVEMKFGKALGLADKLGAKHAVIIGENEIAAGKFTVKRLADAVQKNLSEAELLTELEGK
ncbi:MAG TPA: histidine--tRNA ligase [Candidatus Acidoferrum sp.]|nr:histidine--tRNA ligase [Candidatus Acidoferrum sp.]